MTVLLWHYVAWHFSAVQTYLATVTTPWCCQIISFCSFMLTSDGLTPWEPWFSCILFCILFLRILIPLLTHPTLVTIPRFQKTILHSAWMWRACFWNWTCVIKFNYDRKNLQECGSMSVFIKRQRCLLDRCEQQKTCTHLCNWVII